MIGRRIAVAAAGAALAAIAIYALWHAKAPAKPSVEEPPPSPPLHRARTPFDAAEVILDGKLGKGWDDWGWGKHEFPDAGPARIDFEAYGGIIFHHEPLPSRFGALVFRYKGSETYGDFLRVSVKSGETKLPSVDIGVPHTAVLDDGWYEVMIPWTALDPSGAPFDRIVIESRSYVGSEPVELDKVALTKPLAPSPGTGVETRVASLSIHCDRPTSHISPLIYGMAAPVWEADATGRRIGGNPTTRLNWDLGVWNSGKDWYFENGKPGSGPRQWLDDDLAHGTKSAVTVPMIGWVAKDGTSVGFPVSKFAPEQAHDPNRPEAGNGQRPDGTPILPGPPTETSVAAPPELIRKWIESIREEDRKKGVRSVDMYILDNEPNLWNSTHRDVHPDPTTYDELLDRTLRYGKAIRDADPDAVIAGPAEWGWTGYFFSAKDVENGSKLHVDRRAHGDVPLIPWYLRQLRDHEKQTGVKLLDVLDVHYYPQAQGIYGSPARTDPEGSALRLRLTRSLWDPEYKDESWIDDKVELIPRLKKWIEENYPGRGISIGEWSFGAEEDMSGGLATAEVLGRFGQLGITSAFYWLGPAVGTPAFQAFRAYRNFDGKGAAFLDWSIPTTGAPGVSIFASSDPSHAHVVAVLLNLEPAVAFDVGIDVSTCGDETSRRVFEYARREPGFAARGATEERGLLHEHLAPYSMKVLDLTVSKPPLR